MKRQTLYHHRPGARSGEATTVVYAPRPWAGSPRNSTARFNALADLTGFVIVTTQLVGTGKVLIDRATRRSLRRGAIDDLVAEEAIYAQGVTKDYPVRIGMGDSARATWIARMQTSEHPPFSHVLVRDGINTYAPEGLLQGATRLLRRAGSRGETGPGAVPADPQTKAERLYVMACGAAEIINHGPLMCSTTGMEAMFELARQADTPVHSVVLGHGVSGSAVAVQSLNVALARERSHASDNPAEFLSTYESTWGHGNLMDPDGAAVHLGQTALLV